MYVYVLAIVYDQNHYFGLGPIPKPRPKFADIVTDTKTIFLVTELFLS